MDGTLVFPDNKYTTPKSPVPWMPRTFREIQLDMDSASARLEQSSDQSERRSLLKDMKRLLLESQFPTNVPPIDLHSPDILAAGVVGEPNELALAVLEMLAGRKRSINDHEAWGSQPKNLTR